MTTGPFTAQPSSHPHATRGWSQVRGESRMCLFTGSQAVADKLAVDLEGRVKLEDAGFGEPHVPRSHTLFTHLLHTPPSRRCPCSHTLFTHLLHTPPSQRCPCSHISFTHLLHTPPSRRCVRPHRRAAHCARTLACVRMPTRATARSQTGRSSAQTRRRCERRLKPDTDRPPVPHATFYVPRAGADALRPCRRPYAWLCPGGLCRLAVRPGRVLSDWTEVLGAVHDDRASELDGSGHHRQTRRQSRHALLR